MEKDSSTGQSLVNMEFAIHGVNRFSKPLWGCIYCGAISKTGDYNDLNHTVDDKDKQGNPMVHRADPLCRFYEKYRQQGLSYKKAEPVKRVQVNHPKPEPVAPPVVKDLFDLIK